MNRETINRRSIRLPGYDYSSDGRYFITICVQNRWPLFGEIVNGEMQLNDAGRMIEHWWREIESKFANTIIGVHCVMPNHFHGLFAISSVGADLCVCPDEKGEHIGSPLRDWESGEHAGSPLRISETIKHTSACVPTIVQWMKTMTTNAYIRAVKEKKWTPFSGRLWQRNYYEHIVRNEDDLASIHEYIVMNPNLWMNDEYNDQPTHPGKSEYLIKYSPEKS